MNEMSNKWIGQRTIRPDGAEKVTGSATFAADTAMAGMIWGKVLRSPHPHARIRGIDTSKAEALPGVKAVVTAADIVDFPVDTPVPLGIQDMRWMCRNVMAREKALYEGHAVAAVAATSPEIKSACDRMGLTATIEDAGGIVLEGVCFYQMYAREIGEANGWTRLMSNSAKIVNILGGYGYEPMLASMTQCVDSAVAGKIIGSAL